MDSFDAESHLFMHGRLHLRDSASNESRVSLVRACGTWLGTSGAFANKQDHQHSKAKGVKLVAEASKKGGEGDARWTDYVLDYEDSRRIPPKFRRVFRVPEGAELPTTMTEEWSMDGKTTSRSYIMEYPTDGSADLNALNVPKDAKVVDTRSGDELKTLLAAYAAQ